MTHFLLRKDGIPALACVASATGDAPFLQCTLQVKYDKDSAHATLSLQHSTCAPIPGFADTQSFDLLYDAHNLLPTTTKCQTSTHALTLPDSEYVARNCPSDIRVLTLHLAKPCPIVCSNVASSIVPKASRETSFRRFVDLARSTEIEIAFDWKWLHPKQVGPFLNIVSQPERFRGFPADAKSLKGRWLKDWTVFGPDEESVADHLPSYSEAAHKRPRQISSTPPSPPAKRLFYIPQGSPTEKATTASQPNSPKHTSTTIDESQCTTSSRPVSSHLRTRTEKSHPSQPGTDTNLPPGLEEFVRSIVLDVFSALLAPIDPSRSLSSTHATSAPSPKPTRRLRSLLTARAAAYVETKLSTICSDIEYDANCLRQAADEEFLAGVAEEKLDIKQRKDNALEELHVEIERLVDEKLAELHDGVTELVEQAEEKVEHAINARAAKYMNTTWNKALAGGLSDMGARPEKAAVRKGHAAGDRKRKLCRFRWCAR